MTGEEENWWRWVNGEDGIASKKAPAAVADEKDGKTE